ncbi:MAG: acyl-CoA dehydratase activase [Candidatus Helarchaeales archaeon]
MVMVQKKDTTEFKGEQFYLGIDVGSVSTKFAVLNENMELIYGTWSRSQGSPIKSVQDGFNQMRMNLPKFVEDKIVAVGTTGSARYLTKALVGADIAKTEIISHAVAASYYIPGVRTILEIGGQDSKVILLKDGIITDFAMNSICAAGTGSFLDHQATRLGIPIQEFGDYAERASVDVVIAGRCTVFAESDMIHKQQMGHRKEDIIKGLCNSLVRNYLNNVCKGKKLHPPITFQGGVAANKGIRRAFEEHLGCEIIVHDYFLTMGAIGAAMLAREHVEAEDIKTTFRGFRVSDMKFTPKAFNCTDCPNQCEITYVEQENGEIIARWGDRCGKWSM